MIDRMGASRERGERRGDSHGLLLAGKAQSMTARDCHWTAPNLRCTLIESTSIWHIRHAESTELPTLLTIFDDATTWLVDHGLAGQWGDSPPSQDAGFVARLGTWIEEQLVFLGLDRGDRSHGCLVVGLMAPSYLEPSVAQAIMQDAAYIYSFASRMQSASHGVGAALLARAEQEAHSRGKYYLRLDCWADNAALLSYYQQAGFGVCGNYAKAGWRGALLEKQIPAVA